MTKKHNLRFRMVTTCVIVLAFSCVTATAGSFVYEAVPFQLFDPATPDEPYTISGTLITTCNNCIANVVDWEILVDGPFPHSFTPLNSAFGSGNSVNATPTEIFLRDAFDPLGGPFTFSILESPLSPPNALVFWAVDPMNPITGDPPSGFVDYGDPDGNGPLPLEGIPLDNGRFVIGTIIPEPSAALLLALALSCVSVLRSRDARMP